MFHPFIRGIRITQYGWHGDGPVTTHFSAVSWMDEAHGQLKRITIEDNLKKEEELRIILGKYSVCVYWQRAAC